MRKRIVLLSAAVLLLTAFAAFLLLSPKNPPAVPGTADEPPHSAPADTPTPAVGTPAEAEGEELGSIREIVAHADLAVFYPDIASLTADAEAIVVGRVAGTRGEFHPVYQIGTYIELEIDSVLKGEVAEDTVTVYTQGGVMPSLDFHIKSGELLRDKFEEGEYERMIASIEPGDTVRCDYMGVRQPEPGDIIVGYLTYSREDGCWWFTGSAYWGLLYADLSRGTAARAIEGETAQDYPLADLRALAETTPDNSAALRAESEITLYGVKDDTIEPRDPYYDQFKGDDIVPEFVG